MASNAFNVASLAGRIDQVTMAINTLELSQDRLGAAVNEVASNQSSLHADLRELSRQFEEYKAQDQLAKNVSFAQNQLITVRQELTTEFGHYDTVRRHATGILQGMDAGIVAHQTIRQATEELMLATPRYWLTPALVGLAAWIRDDRELAERGLGEALRRHNDKASLFFSLLLRRHHRDDAAVRWLQQYVARQDAKHLGQEFGVVLDATAIGGFGTAARALVLEHAQNWHERLTANETAVAEQVARWKDFILSQRTQLPDDFETLPQVSSTWEQLRDSYELATVFGGTTGFLTAVFDSPPDWDRRLIDKLDDLLTTLVTEFDTEETPQRRRESELQAVIDHGGDLDAAQKFTEATDAAFDETIDFLTLLTNAALAPERAGVSSLTQRMAIALARDWVDQAAGQIEADAIAATPRSVSITIEGWTGTIDDETSEDDVVQGVETHIDNETQAELETVRFAGSMRNAAIVAGTALVAALIAFASSWQLGLFLLAVAAGGGLWSYSESRTLPRRREMISRRGEDRKLAAVAKVRGALAELVDLRERTAEERAKISELRQYLANLRPESQTLPSGESAREVQELFAKIHGPPPAARAEDAAHPTSDSVVAVELPPWDLVPPTEFLWRPDQTSS